MAHRLDKFLDISLTPIPEEHKAIIEKGEHIDPSRRLKRENINQLFDDGYLECESGYCRLDDGVGYVSVLTKMPKVTIEMIDWWFWWHPKESIRYKMWYPGQHFEITSDFQGSYNDETLSYRERLHLSQHHVTEDIGLGTEMILINFIHPAEFGFNEKHLSRKDVTIICGQGGDKAKGVWSGDMCHFVRQTDQGVEMRSRFWIGHQIARMSGPLQGLLNSIINRPFLKRKLVPMKIAPSLFHHCTQEYHHLAEILPEIYASECNRH